MGVSYGGNPGRKSLGRTQWPTRDGRRGRGGQGFWLMSRWTNTDEAEQGEPGSALQSELPGGETPSCNAGKEPSLPE